MALSATPPTSDPPSTTTTNNNSIATTRPLFPPNPRPPPQPSTSHSYQPSFYPTSLPHPLHPTNPRLPSTPHPNYPHLVPSPQSQDVGSTSASTASTSIPYPVASSGRGFLSKQTSTATLTNPMTNSPLHQARPGLPYPSQLFGHSHPDASLGQGLGYVTGRPTRLQHPTVVENASGGFMPGVIRGVPVSAASSQSQHKIVLPPASISDCNGYTDLRGRSNDNAFATIRDRKVRISDDASVYTLCRSWLRNGFPEESQLQYLDTFRSLPRPLPSSDQDITLPTKKEDDKEIEEDEESVDHLSPQELLRRHIKCSKKVRSRLREERLRRIARYKTRLALLLPPMVDPHLRNDLATGK